MSNSKQKKARRQQRKFENKKKEEEYKKGAMRAGKLLKENHNKDPYSPEFTISTARLIIETLENGWRGAQGDGRKFLEYYRQFSKKIKDLLLYWSPEVPKSLAGFYFLKRSLELYWDTPEELFSKIYEQQ